MKMPTATATGRAQKSHAWSSPISKTDLAPIIANRPQAPLAPSPVQVMTTCRTIVEKIRVQPSFIDQTHWEAVMQRCDAGRGLWCQRIRHSDSVRESRCRKASRHCFGNGVRRQCSDRSIACGTPDIHQTIWPSPRLGMLRCNRVQDAWLTWSRQGGASISARERPCKSKTAVSKGTAAAHRTKSSPRVLAATAIKLVYARSSWLYPHWTSAMTASRAKNNVAAARHSASTKTPILDLIP